MVGRFSIVAGISGGIIASIQSGSGLQEMTICSRFVQSDLPSYYEEPINADGDTPVSKMLFIKPAQLSQVHQVQSTPVMQLPNHWSKVRCGGVAALFIDEVNSLGSIRCVISMASGQAGNDKIMVWRWWGEKRS